MREIFTSFTEKAKTEIKRIRADKDLMGRIYLVTLGTSLIVLALAIQGPEQKGNVITDNEGKATQIERHSLDTSESYDFDVIIREGKERIVREVNLTIQAVTNESNSNLTGKEISREEELDAALDSAVSDMEYSRDKKIILPAELSDGTEISWLPILKKDYSVFILIPVVYIGLLIFVIRSKNEKEGAAEIAERRSILRGLPRFCNQLFLMMNAGMILSDAFERITSAYASGMNLEDDISKTDNGKYFERALAELNMKNKEKRESTAGLLSEFAVKKDVKEMIRIATILTENEKRGSDVIESLSRESRYLWDERKIVARESGKMIDTKMSYPLAILLILLIVITMAPAMLSM